MIKRKSRIASYGQKSRKFPKNHLLPSKIRNRAPGHQKKEDIQEELQATIEEKKDEPMKLTYTDQGQMVLVRGYGKKESSGYSIEVKELYATENAVHIRTELKGPGEKEQVIEKSTWPYIAVKLDYHNRHVVFEE